MFGWTRDPAIKWLVEADALALMGDHGEAAYHIARAKASDARRGVTEGSRPAGYWHRVRREIARITGCDQREIETRRADGGVV